jgi:hypothetical protein
VRFESLTFAQEWCRSNLISLKRDTLGRELPDMEFTETFIIPADSGKRIFLCKDQLGNLDDSVEHLVWITEWGVWPSSERMHIFDRFRISYGEERPLIDAPCALFDSGEIEDLISYVTLAATFLWDVWVFSPGAKQWLFYSHDEYGSHS